MADLNEESGDIKRKLQYGIYKLCTKGGKSRVWSIFGIVKNEKNEKIPNLVCCKVCLKTYKYNNKSTSNLVRHKCYILECSADESVLVRNECDTSEYSPEEESVDEVLADAEDLNDCTDDNSFVNYTDIKRKLTVGIYKISAKRGNCKLWNIFGIIENAKNEAIPHVVCCRSCRNIYKYKANRTSNLIRHKCYLLERYQEKEIESNELPAESESEIKKVLVKNEFNEFIAESESAIKMVLVKNEFEMSECSQEGESVEEVPADAVDLNDCTDDSSFVNNTDIKRKVQDGVYKISSKRGRSRVWSTFGTVENENNEAIPNVVCCRSCLNIYKYNDSTSNLLKHKCYLERPQEEESADAVDLNDCTDDSSFMNYTDIKRKIQDGIYKISAKRGRSRVWITFGTVENENNEAIPNVVCCRKCLNIYKYNEKTTSSGTSNLAKHKCYILDINTTSHLDINATSQEESVDELLADFEFKRKMACLCTMWCAVNCRPYNIVHDSMLAEIISFAVSIGAKHGDYIDSADLLPNSTTVSRNINRVYAIYFNKVQTEMQAVRDIGFGLTTQLWTNNHTKTCFLVVTFHFIKEGNLVKRLLGLKSIAEDKCSHDYILRKVTNLLREFNCELSSKSVVVTDGGPNMTEVFQDYNHIKCVNHLLNNTLQKCMESINELSTLCRLCSKLMMYMKQAGKNAFLITTPDNNSFSPCNTYYYLLETVKKNWIDIVKILKESNQMSKFDSINISYIQLLLPILKQFVEASKQLEGDEYPTIHLTYLYVHKLKRACSVNEADIPIIKNFKENLIKNLHTVVIDNLNIYHKIAIFLFPPTNELLTFNEVEKKDIKDHCMKMMAEYIQTTKEIEESEKNEEKMDLQNNDLFTGFVKSRKSSNRNQSIKVELDRYQCVEVNLTNDFNVLQWWESHKTEYPLLYKVSCKILAIPSSSASSERVLFAARNLISDQRSLLTCDEESINQAMFVKINVEEECLKKHILNLN